MKESKVKIVFKILFFYAILHFFLSIILTPIFGGFVASGIIVYKYMDEIKYLFGKNTRQVKKKTRR